MKKKRRLKKWVRVTLAIIISYSIGIMLFFAMSERASQIDAHISNNSSQYVQID